MLAMPPGHPGVWCLLLPLLACPCSYPSAPSFATLTPGPTPRRRSPGGQDSSPLRPGYVPRPRRSTRAWCSYDAARSEEKNPRGDNNATVSRQTLEATYGRAVQLLQGVGINPAIHAQIEARGYTAEDHAEGWRLVLAAGGYQGPGPTTLPVSSSDAHEAMVKVDAWDEPTHRVLCASLLRHFPE